MVVRRIGDFLKAVQAYVQGKQGLAWVAAKLGVPFPTLQAILLEADLIDVNDLPSEGVAGQDIINAVFLFYLHSLLVKKNLR